MGSRASVGIGGLVAVLFAAPWWMPPWMLFIAGNALAKGLVVLGLVVLLRGGLVSFGHALYFGAGAYTTSPAV